jgi:hypothetical protein
MFDQARTAFEPVRLAFDQLTPSAKHAVGVAASALPPTAVTATIESGASLGDSLDLAIKALTVLYIVVGAAAIVWKTWVKPRRERDG